MELLWKNTLLSGQTGHYEIAEIPAVSAQSKSPLPPPPIGSGVVMGIVSVPTRPPEAPTGISTGEKT